MLALFGILQNRNEEVIALLFDAVAATLSVFEKLCKNCVDVAECVVVAIRVAGVRVEFHALHQHIKPLKQIELQQELSVIIITS